MRAAPRSTAHERHLDFRARDEDRRAGVQHERPVGRQPDLAAERVARPRRPAIEPAIERLCAGHGHGRRGTRWNSTASRFCASFHTATRSVRDAQIALVGQVVPAGDQRADADAARLCGPHEIHLIGSRLDERRHQQRRRAPGVEEPAAPGLGGIARSIAASRAHHRVDAARRKGADAVDPLQRPRQRLTLDAGAQQRRRRTAAGAGSGRNPSCRARPAPGQSSRRRARESARPRSREDRPAGSRRSAPACLRAPLHGQAHVVSAPRQLQHGVVVEAQVLRRRHRERGSSWRLPPPAQAQPVREHQHLVDGAPRRAAACGPSARGRRPGCCRRRGGSGAA